MTAEYARLVDVRYQGIAMICGSTTTIVFDGRRVQLPSDSIYLDTARCHAVMPEWMALEHGLIEGEAQ